MCTRWQAGNPSGHRALLFSGWALVGAGLAMFVLQRGVGLRVALDAFGVAFTFAVPACLVCSLPFAVLSVAARMRDRRRLEDLWLTALSPREVVFGTFYPVCQATCAIMLPIFLAALVGRALGTGGLSPWERFAPVLLLPLLAGWSFLFAVRVVLRSRSTPRLAVVAAIALTVACTALVLLLDHVALHGATFLAGKGMAFFEGWRGEAAAHALTVTAALLISVYVAGSTFSFAGLRWFRALDEDTLKGMCYAAADRVRFWRVDKWPRVARELGGVSFECRVSGFQAPGRASVLSGVLAGLVAMVVVWLGMAWAWPFLFDYVDVIPFAVRLRETAMLHPVNCLVGGIVAGVVSLATWMRQHRGRLCAPAEFQAIALLFRVLPSQLVFGVLSLVSFGAWMRGLEGTPSLVVVAVEAAFLGVGVASATMVILAYAAGRWSRVASLVALGVGLPAAVPVGLVLLPMLASPHAPGEGWIEIALGIFLAADVAVSLAAGFFSAFWLQCIHDVERGWRRTGGDLWRLSATLAVLSLGVLALLPLRGGTARIVSPATPRELQFRFVDAETGEGLRGLAWVPEVMAGEPPGLTTRQGHFGIALPDGVDGRTTCKVSFGRVGTRIVECGEVSLDPAVGEQIVRVGPAEPQRVQLVDDSGAPLPGVEVVVLECLMPDPARVRFNGLEAMLPLACLVTDEAGMVELPAGTAALHVEGLVTLPFPGGVAMIDSVDYARDSVQFSLLPASRQLTIRLADGKGMYRGEGWVRVLTTHHRFGPEQGLVDGAFSTSLQQNPLEFLRIRTTASGAVLYASESALFPQGVDTMVIHEDGDVLVRGVALDARGKPRAGATVVAKTPRGLAASGMGFVAVATCDPEGRFEIPFPGGVPGEIGVSLQKSRDEILETGSFNAAMPMGGSASLPVGSPLRSRDLVLLERPHGSCEVVVVDESGRVVPGARVTAVDHQGEAVTDHAGRATLLLEDVPLQNGEPWQERALMSGIPDPATILAFISPPYNLTLLATDGASRTGGATGRCNTTETFYIVVKPAGRR